MAERELKFRATVSGDAEQVLGRIRKALNEVGKPEGRNYRGQLPNEMKALQQSMVGVRKEVTDAFTPALRMFGVTTAGVAASVVGLTQAMKSFAQTSIQMHNAADAAGTTATNLAKLKSVFEGRGYEGNLVEVLDKFGESLFHLKKTASGQLIDPRAFQQAMEAFKVHGKAGIDTLNQMQKDADDATKALRDLFKLAEGQPVAIRREMFRTAGLPGELADLIKSVKEYDEAVRNVPEPKLLDPQKAREYLEMWQRFNDAAQNFGNTLAESVIPRMTAVMKAVDQAVQNPGWSSFWKMIGTIDQATSTKLPFSTHVPNIGDLLRRAPMPSESQSGVAPGAGTPVPFGSFGRGWDDMRPSTNVEDARGLNRGSVLEENTKELHRLNDNLGIIITGSGAGPGGGALGFLSGGGGGGGGGLGGGGGGPGGGLGGFHGGTGIGGTGPGVGIGPGGGRTPGSATEDGTPSSSDVPRDKSGTPLTPKYGEAPTALKDIAGGVAPSGVKVSGGKVDPTSLYQNLVQRFSQSKLAGFKPEGGEKFGIKTGAPEEWARLGTALASQESSFQTAAAELGHGGIPAGLYQFGAKDLARRGLGTDIRNVDNQITAMIGEMEKVKTKGWAGAQEYFGPFRRPWELTKHFKEAQEIADRAPRVAGGTAARFTTADIAGALAGGGRAPAGIMPGAVTAVGGGPPAAFIMHHTGGRGTVAGVQATLRQRGLGVEYVMDRQGNITQTGGPGAAHMLPGWGKGAGLTNRNVVGMEVIAKDDRDVTPAQVAAAQAFIASKYPGTPVFGHGEVNPGHKEASEGMTIVNAIRRQRESATAAGPHPRNWLHTDRALRQHSSAILGTAKVAVDFKNVPRGVKTTVQGDHFFRYVDFHKTRQMAGADDIGHLG